MSALALLAFVIVGCVSCYAVARGTPVTGVYVHSKYLSGVLVERFVSGSANHTPGESVLQVLEEGPLLPGMLARYGFATDIDGASVTCSGQQVYVTSEDLRASGGYATSGASFEVDLNVVRRIASGLLPSHAVEAGCSYRRVRYASVSTQPERLLSGSAARQSAVEGARFLVRSLQADGRFAYQINGHTGTLELQEEYNWPRHAGTLSYVARVLREAPAPELLQGAMQATQAMYAQAFQRCAGVMCVADDARALLGSSALSLLALVELHHAAVPDVDIAIASLAKFLRSQQRADGEFKHIYWIQEQRAEDVQYPYYSGEAVLALTLAYELTRDPLDLESAQRGLEYLVHSGWKFFGSDYYRAEEHWTCQAMAALWKYKKNEASLNFCVAWFDVQAAMLREDGGFGVTSLLSPRFTPVASKTEAALAIAHVLRQEGRNATAIELQVTRSLTLLMNEQFLPGPVHLFARPEIMQGGLPGGHGDLTVRIDYVQHAGSAFLSYANLMTAQ
jgi:hypothetical protein